MEGKQPEIIAREAQVVGNGLNDKKDAGNILQMCCLKLFKLLRDLDNKSSLW